VAIFTGIAGFLIGWNDHASSNPETVFNQIVSGNPAVSIDDGAYYSGFQSGSSGNFRGVDTATETFFEQPMYDFTNAAMSG
jgi:hypothetical protein